MNPLSSRTTNRLRQAGLRSLRVGALAALGWLAGCASVAYPNPADPFESVNRGIYKFNDKVDRALLRPVAVVYVDVVPRLVRTGVSNFYFNLTDYWSFANSVMQLRGGQAAQTFMRLNVNTFFGLGGILDVATELGIERHPEDFGQTLGRYGVPPGPYVMLPFLGPSTVRDTGALYVDYYGGLISNVDYIPLRNTMYALKYVDLRAGLLDVDRLVQGAALDEYSFIRDVYLQHRLNAVYDGNPPEVSFDVP